MRMDKLTTRFQQALADAQSLAVGRDHPAIEPVHVMAALLDQPQGSTTPLLAQSGVALPAFRKALNEALAALPKVGQADGNVQVGQELGRVLNLADKAAQQERLARYRTEAAAHAAAMSDYAAQLAAVPEFASYGAPLTTSPLTAPVPLTETEMEYVVTASKHVFPAHVVLLF